MTYTLILIILHGSFSPPAVATIDGYTTQEACEAAVTQIKEHQKPETIAYCVDGPKWFE